MKEKIKVLKDTGYSIFAVFLMHAVVQFLIYPFMERYLGTAGYGNFIYMITFVNIVAATIGSGINLERMKLSADRKTYNGDFALMILSLFIVAIPCGIIYILAGKLPLTVCEVVLFLLLCFFTVVRNYGEVDFRLRLDYKNYFWYYVTLTVGYLLGLWVGLQNDNWIVILLIGEICALIFLSVKGKIINHAPLELSQNVKNDFKLVLPVVFSILLSNFIFNMDRIVLKWVCGSEAVSIYYIASLFGKTMSLISLPLNNVAIGYLVKTKMQIDKKKVCVCSVTLLLVALLCAVACTIGSYAILPYLYPETFFGSKKYFIIANLVSVVYFVTSFLTVILLRYGKEKYQLWLNIVYAIMFFVLCIPSCLWYGIWGMCISLLIVNIARFIVAIILLLYSVK